MKKPPAKPAQPAQRAPGILWTLFSTFFRIGLFTFGGGYAMIPLIQRDVVENHQWINDDEMLDMIAIAESTPGVLAVNSATFVGYKVGGFLGAALATIGVALPSFFIISLIAVFYAQFRALTWVQYAFMGIRAGVVLLILNAVVKLSKNLKKNAFNIILILAAFALAAFTEISTILILIGAAICGLVFRLRAIKSGEVQE
ncbi:chromate transporter [Neobittarella massiliensis]|uniref:Chromate transporter, chromate ion transporter (CHR) family n=1 Tax=uncultured Anaerotruncus sp. TaxID=905011 RepID=A0A1C6J1S9_9FIRM|nr:chromate transporter [Neobittarella massiliensis]SCJ75555.1 chromate transporter%2C chromate ion transporter (CHR) family [uncultured Anaerotruncus sp.]